MSRTRRALLRGCCREHAAVVVVCSRRDAGHPCRPCNANSLAFPSLTGTHMHIQVAQRTLQQQSRWLLRGLSLRL